MPTTATTLPPSIRDFLRYLRVQRGRSTRTVRNYQLYLSRFAAFWHDTKVVQLNPTGISKDVINRFRTWLISYRSLGRSALAQASQSYHLIALRSYLRYLKERGIPTAEPSDVELHSAAKRHVNTLTPAQVEALCEAPLKAHQPELLKLRDHALLMLLIHTGLTVSETTTLERKHISSLGIKVERHKKEQTLTLSNDLRTALSHYLELRQDKAKALFVRHDRADRERRPKPITARSIQRLVEHYRKLASIPMRTTPHTLRHTFATTEIEHGKSLKELQVELGYQYLATTSVYRRLNA